MTQSRFFKPSALVGAAIVLSALVISQLTLALSGVSPSTQPVGYVSQDELTNYDLRSGNEVLYRTEYHREFWDGDLVAYQVNAAGNVSAATQPWVAAAGGNAGFQLDTRSTSRIIVTRNSAGTPIPFTMTDLDATQQGAIGSQAVLDFLRGDRSNEVQQGGTLRQRASPLGDVVHSRPFYVKDAIAPTVFVGANDGMLHAFNASTGAERWAYIPSMLVSKLKNLSVNPYVHDYYVDGSVNVGTIASGSQRVLVGGLGAGGRGLYALDITGSLRLAPATETDAKTNALWEVTPSTSGYGNLGYTYSTPVITKVNDHGTVRDVVIVGNGYNNAGDYKAYLYIINAADGRLLYATLAQGGTVTTATGSSSSPNGLSSPVAIDSDGDGNVDFVYAGDLDGTMWKFDLTGLKQTGGSITATGLLTTNPQQPITMTPGVARHPNGGFMVDFATGSSIRDADATDTATYYAYGIWDGKPSANDTLLAQTLTERCYSAGTAALSNPCTARVRTVTANQPDWTSGSGHHKGWRVPLGTSGGTGGEKVVGDGSFIENGRFYFTAYNPNISTTVKASTIKGENWLMELDYLTGGVKNTPFLDMNSDLVLTSDDRVKDSATPPAPVLTTDGVPVGKMISVGVLSQPILVQLSTLNNTLFNQNPDVTIVPVVLGTGTGVTGGHFDVDFFHTTPTAGAQASFTISVGTTGQVSGAPATLGAITVDGVTIVPPLTIGDITDGTAASTNATKIKNMVTNGFTASVSGTTVTIKAPVGAQYNGKTVVVGAGTSSSPAATPYVAAKAATAGTAPSPGTFTLTDVGNNRSISLNCGATNFASFTSLAVTAPTTSTQAQRLNDFYTKLNGVTKNGYTTTCTKSGTTTTSVSCSVQPPVGASACSTTSLFDLDTADVTYSRQTPPSGGKDPTPATAAVPATGWTNFAPALTVTSFNNNGVEPTTPGDACTGTDCKYDRHIHQYDDVYDVTGVNMLNPSDSNLHINLAIPSMIQNFKILVHNQYLSPAVKLNIGDPNYRFDVDFGYVPVKNYQTSMTLDLATVQTYRRDPNAVWPGSASTAAERAALPKPIGSLVFNMPLDALNVKDWWGNGDKRVGLMPMQPQCMWQAAGTTDGNMYKPVNPPAAGVDGPGTKGWSSTTTPATAQGARHGGALMIQLIRDTTPNDAIELNVAGRPEFGWRVKSAQYANYVLAEWGTYWHHPNGKCYSDTGWTKTPPQDNGSSTLQTKAPGSTDPHLGDLSAGGGNGSSTVTSSTTTVVGNVTTTVINYYGGTSATIVRTVNSDGTVTIVTTDALGTKTTQNIANAAGSLKGGGNERGLSARLGRVSWREVVAP